MKAPKKFNSPSTQFLWESIDATERPLWAQLIWEGELTMLDGRPEEAEQIYLAALAEAKELPAEDVGWLRIQMNLRYLYHNFLCPRPTTPEAFYERTVPLWSQILGPDHHFIATWNQSISEWRERGNER